MPREPQTPRNPNLKKKNCRCLPSHSAYTNTILLYSTRSVSTHGVGNCLVEINLPTLPLSCSRLESRRVNRSMNRSMVIRSSLPAYLSNILFDLYIRTQYMGDLGPEILHIFSENTFQSSRLLVFVSLGEDKWGVLLS